MKFQLALKRNGGISEQELLFDLQEVSKKLKKDGMTMDEYEKNGKYSRGVYKRKFGGWNNALKKAKLGIIKRGNNTVVKEELFENLAYLWERLGKQPSQSDCDEKYSNFHSSNYKKIFGTYNTALKEFAKWAEGEWVDNIPRTNKIVGHRTKREINLRLRVQILQRDRYTCQYCGWSPAKNIGERMLEVDHKIPWEKGGETVQENLQVLCSACNGGKSNVIFNS